MTRRTVGQVSFRARPDGGMLMVADGLGHGAAASVAAQRAIGVLRETDTSSPVAVAQCVHRALAGTRGAAVAVADIRRHSGQVAFVGIGNISGTVSSGGIARSMVSHHGTAGVTARLQEVAPLPVFVDTGFFITVPERSLLGDLVKRAKGESVAGPNPGPGPFPLADLRDANPKVFLATSDSDVTLDSLRANPLTAKLRAVKRKRLEFVPNELVTRAGPRIADGLEAVAKALHPDAFQ